MLCACVLLSITNNRDYSEYFCMTDHDDSGIMMIVALYYLSEQGICCRTHHTPTFLASIAEEGIKVPGKRQDKI